MFLKRAVLVGLSMGLALVLPAAPLAAQEEPIGLRDGYRPASSFAQLKDCHFRALTIGIDIDSTQESAFREAIEVFRDTAGPRLRSIRDWQPRFVVRDSTMLAVLRTAADSSRFRRNVKAERGWFAIGNCNGK